MGIELTISFKIDGEEEQVAMELFPDGSIYFPEYDIDTDIMATELGDEPSIIHDFWKGPEGFETRKLSALSGDPEHAEMLVDAIKEQGLGDFDRKEYTDFLESCMVNSWRYGFEPIDAIKEVMTDDEFKNVLKRLITDDHLGHDDFDPVEAILEYISMEELIKWLISEIEKDVEGDTGRGYYNSNASDLASTLNDLLRSQYTEEELKEILVIDETSIDLYEYHHYDPTYTNITGKRYCLWIFDVSIGCWKTVVESKIMDPVSFQSDTEQWDENYGHEYEISNTLASVLSELDLDEPELGDPDPPDYPKPDPTGDYAVIYLLKENTPHKWMIVPYESKFDATEAAELSRIIADRDGFNMDIHVAQAKEGIDRIDSETLQVLVDYLIENGITRKNTGEFLGRNPTIVDLFFVGSELHKRGIRIQSTFDGIFIRSKFASYTEIEDEEQWFDVYDAFKEI